MSPQRTCIACRRTDDQDRLWRLVRVSGRIVDGTSPRLPGRGSYLHPDPACIGLLVKRRTLPRTFGPGAVLDDELAARLEALSPGWNHKPPAR